MAVTFYADTIKPELHLISLEGTLDAPGTMQIEDAFREVRAVLIEEIESRLVGRRVELGNDRRVVGRRGLDREDIHASVETRCERSLPLAFRRRAVRGPG